MTVRPLLLLLGLVACADEPDEAPAAQAAPTDWVLRGANLVGVGVVDVEIRGGRVAALGAVDPALPVRDGAGLWLAPAFVDAHVHVVYDPRGGEQLRGGIAGAVDWAAPLDRLDVQPGPRMVWAGPILTAPGGYPTRGWGRDGYGLVCADAERCAAAVDLVHDAGARVVKIAVGAGGPQLSDASLRAICERAHALDLPVGAHALSDADALRAAQVGADVLVHAPSERLSAATVAAWSGKSVVSTLAAFGGVESTRQLRAAGATVLYGTDLGNTVVAGISEAELRGLLDAGLDGAAILAAGTAAPARRFGFAELGAIEVGKEASLLVLGADPRVDPLVLARPRAVVHRGVVVAGELP